jgi:hypothetical protein
MRVKLNRFSRWVDRRFFGMDRLKDFLARDATLNDQWFAALRALNLREMKRLRVKMNENHRKFKERA